MDTAHWPPAAQYPRPPDSAPVFPAVAPPQASHPAPGCWADPLAAATGAGGLGLHSPHTLKHKKDKKIAASKNLALKNSLKMY